MLMLYQNISFFIFKLEIIERFECCIADIKSTKLYQLILYYYYLLRSNMISSLIVWHIQSITSAKKNKKTVNIRRKLEKQKERKKSWKKLRRERVPYVFEKPICSVTVVASGGHVTSPRQQQAEGINTRRWYTL